MLVDIEQVLKDDNNRTAWVKEIERAERTGYWQGNKLYSKEGEFLLEKAKYKSTGEKNVST